MSTIRVLVVDDEWGVVESLLTTVKNKGFSFSGISDFSVTNVLGQIGNSKPSILLLDILHAGHEQAGQEEAGIRLFNKLGENEAWKKLAGSVQIVFFSTDATAQREWRVARERRSDVSGYVSKEKILNGDSTAWATLRRAGDRAKWYSKYPDLADRVRKECLLLHSPNSHAVDEVVTRVLQAARCSEPVLIQGETGTGKELVAKGIYDIMQAEAMDRPRIGSGDFLPWNIGGSPTEGNLQYMELFGAKKEAFSGCTKDRMGLFSHGLAKVLNGEGKQKHPPTIFLDEIGDAHASVQVALLRVLQEKVIHPLGIFNEPDGFRGEKVAFRLITASHARLPDRVREGKFREDLYYRLSTLVIKVPPLRERKDDIPVLVFSFLEGLNEEYGLAGTEKEKTVSQDFIKRLVSYDWPGNVRQLQSVVRAAFALSPGAELDIPSHVEETLEGREPDARLSPEQILCSLEKCPLRLPEIAKAYSIQDAIATWRLLAERCGKHLEENEAQKYFNSSAATVKRWITAHKVKSPNHK